MRQKKIKQQRLVKIKDWNQIDKQRNSQTLDRNADKLIGTHACWPTCPHTSNCAMLATLCSMEYEAHICRVRCPHAFIIISIWYDDRGSKKKRPMDQGSKPTRSIFSSICTGPVYPSGGGIACKQKPRLLSYCPPKFSSNTLNPQIQWIFPCDLPKCVVFLIDHISYGIELSSSKQLCTKWMKGEP